jgi:hypothetical protein
MAKKRFLNVRYENQRVEIDTGHMERISEVQREVLLAFKEIAVGYARVQLCKRLLLHISSLMSLMILRLFLKSITGNQMNLVLYFLLFNCFPLLLLQLKTPFLFQFKEVSLF